MWGWGRPKRDLPEINYNESSSEASDEDFEGGLKFDSPLRSPQGPLNTREGSPLNNVAGGPTLADNVDDILEEAQYKLHDIAVVREEIEEITDLLDTVDTKVDAKGRKNHHQLIIEDQVVVEGRIQVKPEAENAAENNMPDPPPQPVNYDREGKEDGDKASENARHIKVEFAQNFSTTMSKIIQF